MTSAAQRALHAIDTHDESVRAWTHVDRDALQSAAAHPLHNGQPLNGVVTAVKDIIATADMPTEYGSAIYRGHRPVADAPVVLLLKQAGALIAGKTATAEFAFLGSGPTRNPHRLTHTPGGSSMGSAAAVAAGMADLALGTQTAGSIIRPASFCGVIGFKPTFGLVSTVGVKAVAPSCDTVGWFVRDPTLLTQVWAAVLGASAPPPSPKSIRFGVLRTRDWNFADDVSRTAVLDASQRLRQLGHNTRELQLENVVAETGRAQKVIMMYEALRSLLWEYTVHADLIGGASLAALDAATELTTADYQEALAAVETARCCINDLFEDADVIITPAAIGEAPLGHSSTGDPMFARAWTQLGVPTAAVPWTTGPHGLPVAVQLIARPNHDATLISAVQYLAEIGPNSSEQPASSAH